MEFQVIRWTVSSYALHLGERISRLLASTIIHIRQIFWSSVAKIIWENITIRSWNKQKSIKRTYNNSVLHNECCNNKMRYPSIIKLPICIIFFIKRVHTLIIRLGSYSLSLLQKSRINTIQIKQLKIFHFSCKTIEQSVHMKMFIA